MNIHSEVGTPQPSCLRKSALLILSALMLAITVPAFSSCAAFGESPDGPRLQRILASPNHDGDGFVNTTPIPSILGSFSFGLVNEWMGGEQIRYPEEAIPTVPLGADALTIPPKTGLALTWMGHSTALIEIDGFRVLTDPVWSERVSFSSVIGPARFHEPPISLPELPVLDAVIISHDHYDHLDMDTITALSATGVMFVVPLGVGAHLERWGVSDIQIVELDWWERWTMPGSALTFVATPAQHNSGRNVTTLNATLWSSWVVRGPQHRVYFGGDTGMFPGFTEIGTREGPFDAALMPIGAYNDEVPAWKAVHLNPEDAVKAHTMVRGGVMFPMHWATFNLGFHDWFEPAERLVTAAQRSEVAVSIPKVGQRVEPANPPALASWWKPATSN